MNVRRTLVISCGLAVGLAGGVAALWARPSRALRVEAPALDPFRPNEVRQVAIRLSNRGLTTLRLGPPETTCGCVLPEAVGDLTVPPLGSADLRLTVAAGDRPNVADRRVTFRPAGGAPQSVTLRVAVEAKIWAEPSALAIEYPRGPGPAAAPPLLLHCDPDVTVAGVTSDSPAIAVSAAPKDGGGLSVTCRLAEPNAAALEEGRTTLRVAGAVGTILEVPVSWRPQPHARFFPQSLTVAGFGSGGGRPERPVSLFTRGEGRSFTAEPLVPWVSLRTEPAAGGGGLIRVAFDPPRMPDTFDAPIFRVRLQDDPVPYVYHASGTRGPAAAP